MNAGTVWSAWGTGDSREIGERADGGVLPCDYRHQRIYAVLHLRLRGSHFVEGLTNLDQRLSRIEIRASWNCTARKHEQAGKG